VIGPSQYLGKMGMISTRMVHGPKPTGGRFKFRQGNSNWRVWTPPTGAQTNLQVDRRDLAGSCMRRRELEVWTCVVGGGLDRRRSFRGNLYDQPTQFKACVLKTRCRMGAENGGCGLDSLQPVAAARFVSDQHCLRPRAPGLLSNGGATGTARSPSEEPKRYGKLESVTYRS
jgi:hypothetical protein